MGGKLKSYPYQADIISAALASSGNVLIMLPTGGGKTHIASEISKKSKKILFLAPKINLLEQTVNSFKHLNPQVIHGSKPFDRRGDVYVSTLQTISRRPELLVEMNFDVIIIDEVHFGNNGKMQEVIKQNHTGRFIALSATPYDSMGKVIEGYDLVLDKYDIQYLINHGYLTTVDVICPLEVDLSGVKITGGDYNLKELDYKMSSPLMIAATVNETFSILKERNKTIIFCVSIEHAEKLLRAYSKVFKDHSIKKTIRTLHSKIDKKKIASTLNQFINGKIDIIISVDMITTGFNAPAVDSMVIARPTKSQNLYKQMVGRGTRNFPGKKYCLLLDCGNVVSNLGMPLDPIVEVDKKGVSVVARKSYSCPECGSKKPKAIVSCDEGSLCRVCQSCRGDKEPYEGSRITECSYCGFLHTYSLHEKNYVINRFGIALSCKGCRSITPLSFFRASDQSIYAGESDISWSLIDHLLAHEDIFFKDVFIELGRETVSKKKKTYAKMMFGKKNIKYELLYKKLMDDINRELYTNAIHKLTIRELRQNFIDFCFPKTKRDDLLDRILAIERLYLSKYGKLMRAEIYRKVALHHVSFFSSKK